MITVTIKLLSQRDRETFGVDEIVTHHRTSDPLQARGWAIRRFGGTKAFFQPDSGPGLADYGQIFRRLTESSTSVTGRIRIDVEQPDSTN